MHTSISYKCLIIGSNKKNELNRIDHSILGKPNNKNICVYCVQTY